MQLDEMGEIGGGDEMKMHQMLDNCVPTRINPHANVNYKKILIKII